VRDVLFLVFSGFKRDSPGCFRGPPGLFPTLLHRQFSVPSRPMLRLLPAGLRQLRVVVRDIKPLCLPVLVRVDELA
jgi:hypothetical protein